MGLGRGMGRMFQNEMQGVIAGTGGICLAGCMLSLSWFTYIADRKPRTFTPAWEKATVKYRAAQNQDPISNM